MAAEIKELVGEGGAGRLVGQIKIMVCKHAGIGALRLIELDYNSINFIL